MTGPFQNWLTPAEDTLIYRITSRRSRRGKVPPGGLLCGLWCAQRAAGLGPRWRYRMATIDAGALVLGEKQRIALRIRDAQPIAPTDPVREDFRTFAAVLLDSGVEVQLCADRRDVYKLLESTLLQAP